MLFDAITILKCIFFICFFHAIEAYLLVFNRSSSEFGKTPHNIDDEKDNKNVLDNFKRVLVKKIVPHGQIDYNLKYDAKHNSLYKPLARFHKFKPVSALVDKISKKLKRHNQIYQDRHILRDKYKKLKLKPFLNKLLYKQHTVKTSDADFITSELNSILNKIDSTMLSAERKLLKIINKMFKKHKYFSYINEPDNEPNNILDDEHVLDLVKDIKNRIRDLNRRNKKTIKGIRDIIQKKLVKKRGLRVEELFHGKSMEMMTESPTPKPFDKWLPEYSLWNFWTYKQSLYEDQCPDQQVKLGDLCIWTPIHR